MTRITRFRHNDETTVTKDRVIEVVEEVVEERRASHSISGIEHEIASLEQQIALIEARKQEWVDLKAQLMAELSVDEEMLERPMREPETEEEQITVPREETIPRGDEPIRSDGGR